MGGADLCVFPELSIIGYPPKDLLLKPSFIDDNLRAGQTIVLAAVERLRARGVTDEEIRRLFEAELAGLSKKTGDQRG